MTTIKKKIKNMSKNMIKVTHLKTASIICGFNGGVTDLRFQNMRFLRPELN